MCTVTTTPAIILDISCKSLFLPIHEYIRIRELSNSCNQELAIYSELSNSCNQVQAIYSELSNSCNQVQAIYAVLF